MEGKRRQWEGGKVRNDDGEAREVVRNTKVKIWGRWPSLFDEDGEEEGRECGS